MSHAEPRPPSPHRCRHAPPFVATALAVFVVAASCDEPGDKPAGGEVADRADKAAAGKATPTAARPADASADPSDADNGLPWRTLYPGIAETVGEGSVEWLEFSNRWEVADLPTSASYRLYKGLALRTPDKGAQRRTISGHDANVSWDVGKKRVTATAMLADMEAYVTVNDVERYEDAERVLAQLIPAGDSISWRSLPLGPEAIEV